MDVNVKTRDEIEDLKREWAENPDWEIEDTEGFDDYREELAAFAVKMKTQWDAEYDARQAAERAEYEAHCLLIADKLGVPGNIALAKEVWKLNVKIANLIERIDALENPNR